MALNPAVAADARARGEAGRAPGQRPDRAAPRPRDPAGSPDEARQAADDTLAWSVAAMSGALGRLAAAAGGGRPQVVAAATEAVWWAVTVNAAMTREHPAAYGHVLAALDPADRKAVERSLAGLRFIRGQLGDCNDPADFIHARPAPGTGPAREWAWSAVPPPPPRRGKAREVSPFREYRAELAGQPVAGALGRVAGFLREVQARAVSRPEANGAATGPRWQAG